MENVFYAAEIVICNNTKCAGLINRVTLCSEVKKLEQSFYTYVVVFSEEACYNLLNNLGLAICINKHDVSFKTCAKNILQCLANDCKFIQDGYLYEITANSYHDWKSVNRNLELNRGQVDKFIYNPMINSLAFCEAVHFSLKECNQCEFNMTTILGNWWEMYYDENARCWEWDSIRTDIEPLEKLMPVVSFDLEVVTTNEITFPRGIYDYEKIVSCSIVAEFRGVTFCFLFLLAEGDMVIDEVKLTNYLTNKCPQYEMIKVLVEPTEDLLIQSIYTFLARGLVMVPFNLNPEQIYVLTGYNINEFDIPFLFNRLMFYGHKEMAKSLNTRKFTDNRLCLDMYAMIYRYNKIALGVNLTLDNMAKIYLGKTKVPIKICDVRLLYQCHEARPFDNIEEDGFEMQVLGQTIRVPSLYYLCYYNIIDSELVLGLNTSQSFVSRITNTCKQINHALTDVQFLANSKMILAMMNKFYLENKFWLNSATPQIIVPNLVDIYQSKLDDETMAKVLLNTKNSFSLDQNLVLRTEYESVTEDMDPNHYMYIDETGNMIMSKEGSFAGGTNAHKQGWYFDCASLDFNSFYPSLIKENRLDLGGVGVLSKGQLLSCINARGSPTITLEDFFKHFDVYDYDFNMTSQEFLDTLGSKKSIIDKIDLNRFNILADSHRLFVIFQNAYSLLHGLVQYFLDNRAAAKIRAKSGNLMVAESAKAEEQLWKMLACSIFGCLGYRNFACRSMSCAAAITFLAKYVICLASYMLHARNHQVIYIDTDGVIINFAGTNKELVSLADDITKELGYEFIVLKPETTYKYCIVLSCKKYITYSHAGELTIKGWIKNSIEPLKAVVNAWFNYVFDQLGQANVPSRAKSWRLEYSAVDLLVMIMTELELLWNKDVAQNNILNWRHFLLFNLKSKYPDVLAFCKEMHVKHQAIEGTRIPVLYVLERGMSKIIYSDARYDLKDLRPDMIKYVYNAASYIVNFSLQEKFHSSHLVTAWNLFKSGQRRNMTNYPLTFRFSET